MRVYLALALHADQNGQCFPKVGTLADLADLRRRAVQQALARLETEGLIIRQRRDGRATLYSLSPSGVHRRAPVQADAGVHDDAPTRASRCTGPAHGGAPITDQVTEPRTETDREGDVERQEFRDDFELWRSTLAKASAARVKPSAERRRKYKARRRDSSREEVQEALQGWQFDPWPERGRYNDLTILLRDRAQVEKFSELFRNRNATASTTKRATKLSLGSDDSRRSRFAELDAAPEEIASEHAEAS